MKAFFLNAPLVMAAIALLVSCASAKPTTLPEKEITDWQERHENIIATAFATREQIANFPRQESKNPAVSMAHKIPSEYLADSRHDESKAGRHRCMAKEDW